MAQFALAAVIGFAVLGIAASVELYDDKYDYIEARDILADDSVREQYYKCFMGSGPCVTDDAKFFAENFPEAVVTKCMKCTAKQQEMFGLVVTWYTENRPEEWEALMVKTLEVAKQKYGST